MTRLQTEVLEYIKHFITANGYAPTYREIAEGLNLSAISQAYKIVKRLEKENLIIISKHGIRKIRLPATLH